METPKNHSPSKETSTNKCDNGKDAEVIMANSPCPINNNELQANKSPTPTTNSIVGIKRKLDVPNSTFLPPDAFKQRRTEDATQYIHGNYDRYYGYRSYPGKDFKDVRLDAFAQHKQLFEDKSVLDIGCNNGLMTTAVARDFKVKSMIGIDIDKNLIGKAIKWLSLEKKNYPNAHTKETYPHSVLFRCGNYVLADYSLLELETAQFDTILCLSVSKWIHLNGGDAAIKLAFKRMYKQLLPGGSLVLEAQNWKSYKRRKKLTPQIFENYQKIELVPSMFDDYLLSAEVGFCRWYLIEMSEQQQQQAAKGFQRPLKRNCVFGDGGVLSECFIFSGRKTTLFRGDEDMNNSIKSLWPAEIGST